MKRFASVAALVAAACAGAVASVLLAAGPAGADEGTTTAATVTTTLGGSTMTTAPTATTPAPVVTTTTSTQPAARPKARPAVDPAADAPREPAVAMPRLLAAGLSVGGALVGGLTKREARALVEQRFARPLTLLLPHGKRIRVAPRDLGAQADVVKALRTASTIRGQGFLVPLDVRVPAARVGALLDGLAPRVERKPRDARLVLRNGTPMIVDARPGTRLRRDAAARAITLALRTHSRDEVALPLAETPAKVQADAFHTAIVIERGSNRLTFFVDGRRKRTFRVATGAPSYPTPLGRFTVVNMQRHPWWYPPASDWAQGLAPVPPGPSNPLGTRWMGISSPNVGIHGTPNAASIGYSASHGCIRMLIPEVEWLFQRVELGTTVFIVAA